MKITFLWWTCEPYFADCWRALASRPGVEIEIIALAPDPGSIAPHDPAILAGLQTTLLPPQTLGNGPALLEVLRKSRPDVIATAGWLNRAANWALCRPELRGAAVVMAMDTQSKGTLRQWAGRWWQRELFARTSCIVVPGERAWQLARRLGFQEKQIHRGMYGVDTASLEPVYEDRLSRGDWPRQFLYVGRLVKSKGVVELAGGYRRYVDLLRSGADQRPAWKLACCGNGTDVEALQEAGAELRGFVQTKDLIDRGVWRDAGVLVLVSRYEPWGQALLEACAAGLPVISSEAAGASVEMVRSFHNGVTVPTGDADAVGRAMLWFHQNQEHLPGMGARSRELASAYSAERWAKRWEHACRMALNARRSEPRIGASRNEI